jgi:hypothetical protein
MNPCRPCLRDGPDVGLARLMAICLGLMVMGGGCRPSWNVPMPGTLLVTQVPGKVPPDAEASDWLDLRYPHGSRIVRAHPDEGFARAVLLTEGLEAAGSPTLGPDGQMFLFVGKRIGAGAMLREHEPGKSPRGETPAATEARLVGKDSPSSDWQIYRGSVAGGRPEALTAVPGGAMDPAWLPGGRFVFSAPVPRLRSEGQGADALTVPALYTLSVTGGVPMRLTFGPMGAVDPTVLADGRILFVSGIPPAIEEHTRNAPTSLFTINNDGTEITAFAAQHDGPAVLRRPREWDDGRILFLAAGLDAPGLEGRIEQVLMARPFRSRSVTFLALAHGCRSAEAAEDGTVLASLSRVSHSGAFGFGLFRLTSETAALGEALLDSPDWEEVEAVSATRIPQSTGRLSTVDASRGDAALLCLNTHFTDPSKPGPDVRRGTTIRMVRRMPTGTTESLGQTRVHSDGSFLVRVPADVALGAELLDDQGTVLRRCPPVFWLRPGENRSCVGCHEPHNVCPENARPLAVLQAPVDMLPSGFDPPSTPAFSP